MSCPYLEYREAVDDRTFDVARAYCTAAGRFVQPMRADLCNDRYDLDHTRDCELYRAAEDLPPVGQVPTDGDATDGEGRP